MRGGQELPREKDHSSRLIFLRLRAHVFLYNNSFDRVISFVVSDVSLVGCESHGEV